MLSVCTVRQKQKCESVRLALQSCLHVCLCNWLLSVSLDCQSVSSYVHLFNGLFNDCLSDYQSRRLAVKLSIILFLFSFFLCMIIYLPSNEIDISLR